MVHFEWISHSEERVTYAYYSEGDKNAEYGLVKLNTVAGKTMLVIPAQGDYQRVASAGGIRLEKIRG